MSPELYENIRDWDPTWNGPVVTLPDRRFSRWFTGARKGDEPGPAVPSTPPGRSAWAALDRSGWFPGEAAGWTGAAWSSGWAGWGMGPANPHRTSRRSGRWGRCRSRLCRTGSVGMTAIATLLTADSDRVSRIEW